MTAVGEREIRTRRRVSKHFRRRLGYRHLGILAGTPEQPEHLIN